MAKMKQGILDGFSGKVGPAVGLTWKGIPVMRAYSARVRNPRTPRQQLHRACFAMVGRLSHMLYGAVSLGFHYRADELHTTASGLFVRHNMSAVDGGSPSTLTVDYSRLAISVGELSPVEFGSAEFTSPCEVDVPVTGSGLSGPCASGMDRVVLVAFCPACESSTLCSLYGRKSPSVGVLMPASWIGQEVHLYGFVLGGSSWNLTQASPTAYIGSGLVQ